MKKNTYLLLITLFSFNISLFGQNPSQTLVSNIWQLDELVINGETISKPETVTQIDLETGNSYVILPNIVRLTFTETPDNIYKVNSNLPFGSSEAFFLVSDMIITQAPNTFLTSNSSDSSDITYENFKSTYLNSYAGTYVSGEYTIENNILRLGNQTTYGLFSIYSPCNSLNSPFGNSNQVLQQGQMLSELDVLPGAGYSLVWYGDSELTTEIPANTIATSATYYVVQKDNECTSIPLIVTVTINPSADLNTEQLENLKIYPNPTSDIINISYPLHIKTIEVYDLLGKRLLSINVNEKETQLDLVNLNTGIYIIKIKTVEGLGTKKLIKK